MRPTNNEVARALEAFGGAFTDLLVMDDGGLPQELFGEFTLLAGNVAYACPEKNQEWCAPGFAETCYAFALRAENLAEATSDAALAGSINGAVGRLKAFVYSFPVTDTTQGLVFDDREK